MGNNQLKKRILLIDDDQLLAGLLTLNLIKEKYEVTLDHNGAETIGILSEQSVDMIIVDLMMLKMYGLAFLNWLRLQAKATIPALVLTGMTTTNTEQPVISAGGTALLCKPIKVPALLAKIKQLEQLI